MRLLLSEEANLSGIHRELGFRVWGDSSEIQGNPLIDQNSVEMRDRWPEQRELFRMMLEAEKGRIEQETVDRIHFLAIVGHFDHYQVMLWHRFDRGPDVRDELKRLYQIHKCVGMKVSLNDDGEIQVTGRKQTGEQFIGFPVMISERAYLEWEQRADKHGLYPFFMEEGLRLGSESLSELEDFTTCFMNGEKLQGIGQYW